LLAIDIWFTSNCEVSKYPDEVNASRGIMEKTEEKVKKRKKK